MTKHLPHFQMYDPYVTREMTIRDLLTHRSGLGLGAGDLMFWPQTTFTRDDIVHNLRYITTSSFAAICLRQYPLPGRRPDHSRDNAQELGRLC